MAAQCAQSAGAGGAVRCDGDGAGWMQAEAFLEILVGVVKDDIGLLPERDEMRGELALKAVDPGNLFGGIGALACRSGGVNHRQGVGNGLGHCRCVAGIEPDMRIQPAFVFMHVFVVGVVGGGPGATVAQRVARQPGGFDQRDHAGTARQGPKGSAQEGLQHGADPEHHIGFLQAPRFRRAQRVGVGRASAFDQGFRCADPGHDTGHKAMDRGYGGFDPWRGPDGGDGSEKHRNGEAEAGEGVGAMGHGQNRIWGDCIVIL